MMQDDLAVSSQEERVWLLEMLAPGTAVNNVPFAFDLQGDLDIVALQHSVHALVERHERLRMRFPEVGGLPVPQPVDPATIQVDITVPGPGVELDELLAAEAE